MLRIKREELLQQLEAVQPGISKREIIEQSSCFIFKDGQVITYNDEVACRYKTDLGVEGAVQSEQFLTMLNKLKEEELEVVQENGEIILVGKGRKAGFRMEADITLPVHKVETPEEWHPLHEDFTDAINIVQQCAGRDESRFTLTCVHLHPKWVEACDNEQLSRYRIKTSLSASTLVKQQSLKHIVTLGMTEISETQAWLHFRNSAGLVLSCRRYVEDYPDLTPLLEVKGAAAVLPKGLAEAADRAEVFSGEDDDNNKVTVELRTGKCRIRGEGANGWYSETKPLKYSGVDLKFRIAPKLLAEIVRRHNECELNIGKLKVDGGKFVYVSCLGVPEGEKE